MKQLLKKCIIIWTLICVLLPTVFSGFVFADDENAYLNTERAGNFVANFAINFYENWSSVTVETEEGGAAYTSSGSADGVLQAGQKIYDDILLGNYNIRYDDKTGRRNSEQICTNKYYSEENGMDCSTFTSAALWLAGYEQFALTQNTYQMIPACQNGTYASYGMEIYRNDGTNVYKWNESSSEFEILSGVTPYEILQPGDIIVINEHTNIVKTVLPESSSNKYLALDCGNENSWQNVDKYRSNGGGTIWDIWTSVNWSYEHYMCSEAYLIRAVTNKSSSPATSTKKATVHGIIKTEYDSNVDPKAEVEEGISDDEYYKFNNLSWISFVYNKSIFRGDSGKSGLGIDDILTDDLQINTNRFDNKTKIPGVKETINTSDALDIPRLISEGKILPGDVLFAEDGDGGSEYLLYVGGAKVIYATGNPKSFPSGALKYEYLTNYTKRIKQRLQEKYGEDFEEQHKYGVTQVYRINKKTAESVLEIDTNLFFNGKGYYTNTKYDGLPKKVSVSERTLHPVRWVFDVFEKLIEFLINLLIYMVRMQIIGWANLFENLIQHTVMGISGHDDSAGVEAFFGSSGTTASGDRVTVESIFFNRIPILDANFFDFKSAGGHSLLIQSSQTDPVPDQDNLVYKLRLNLSTWYVIIRNASLAILLLMLVVYGIKIAITSSAEKKADYKQLLLSWFVAMCIVVFIHLFMYLVFVLNNQCVDICENWANNTAHAESDYLIDVSKVQSQAQEEMNLYDAIRIKAYAFDWREGVPATIIYVFLIYLLIRFLFIYFKRYLTIYILALSGSFMGVKYAIDKLQGKKTTSLNKWFKDFAFNVLLQTVHAFIYVLFMSVALNVASTSIPGAFVAFIILNFMLKADQIIIKIFGLDKADSLAGVNKSESWRDVVHKLMPMWTIWRGSIGLGRRFLSGVRSPIHHIRMRTTGTDNIKDAEKILEQRRYERIGRRARRHYEIGQTLQGIRFLKIGNKIKWINEHTPIKRLWEYNQYKRKMGNNLSKDMNKAYLKAIKDAKKLRRARFTRPLSTIKDVALGVATLAAAPAIAIADPVVGIALASKAKQMIDKHTIGRPRIKQEKYYGTKKESRINLQRTRNRVNSALNLHTDNEYSYQEARNALLDELATKAPNSAEALSIRQQIKDMDRARAVEKSKELHELQLAYEDMYEAEQKHANARRRGNDGVINKALNVTESVAGKVGRTLTGYGMLGEVATTEARAGYKASEDAKKAMKKLQDVSKVADLEKELRVINKELKQEMKDYAANKGWSEEMLQRIMKNDLENTRKESKKLNIKTSYITAAVNDYLYENNIDKISAEDVDGVLAKLQKMLADSGKSIVFSSETRNKIKKKLKQKMTKDNKGLGFDAKDTTVEIRKALGDNDVLQSNRKSAIRGNETDPTLQAQVDRINDLQNKLLEKMRDINTYNEVGKVKYKQSLINLNKSMKDAKKL